MGSRNLLPYFGEIGGTKMHTMREFCQRIMKTMKVPISLRRRLLTLIVVSWIVPVTIIFLFLSLSYRNNIMDKTETLMEEGLQNFTAFHSQKLDEAISISKRTSYEEVIEKAWRKYQDGIITEAKFYNEVIGNLKSKYYNDNRFVMSAVYLTDNPDKLYYTSRKTKSYIDTYIGKVQQEARKITELDDSDAHVKILDGRIYIIRNLYTTRNYTKFATLIVELDKTKLFDGINLNSDYELGFYVNDTRSMIIYSENMKEESRIEMLEQMQRDFKRENNRKLFKVQSPKFTGLSYQQKYEDYYFGAVLIADNQVIYSELKNIYTLVIVILLIVIPVFLYMLFFISKHITSPMSRMTAATKEIKKGKLGLRIEGEPMPNVEFASLMESFNRMSDEVKRLFDFAYNEKLARKEAKIIALQSQINPHFLNNTLEMMNWQARMAGDVEVSKMIEALGTLLDYSMDRSNKKMISLSEELRCAEAYFYIISMRFGQRLRVEKSIDQELLQLQVPQLILQPLLENAVVHGVEAVKKGVIELKIFREGNLVVLQVINTGKAMSEEEVARVRNILAGRPGSILDGKGKHTSMGVRNVNERIKLIYGEKYGLTIAPVEGTDEDLTAATITLPYEMDEESDEGIHRGMLEGIEP